MADIARLRNIAVVGPHHAGKTTLVEAMLAHCGAICAPRLDRGRHDRDRSRARRRRSRAVHDALAFAHASAGDIDMTDRRLSRFRRFF